MNWTPTVAWLALGLGLLSLSLVYLLALTAARHRETLRVIREILQSLDKQSSHHLNAIKMHHAALRELAGLPPLAVPDPPKETVQ